MSVFGENDSFRLSNFLQTHIFWKFDHISRTYNQINYRNVWFPKVIIILIMTAQALFFNAFSEKDQHFNAVEHLVLPKFILSPSQSSWLFVGSSGLRMSVCHVHNLILMYLAINWPQKCFQMIHRLSVACVWIAI